MWKRKVLVIDDDEVARMLAEMSLGLHFDVTSAASGRDALTLVQHEKPDLILLDVLMAEMDGLTTLLRLREQAGCAHTPVIFLTASPGSKETQECLKLDPVGILAKPFSPQELPQQINQIMAELWPTEKAISVLVVDDVPLICDTVKMLLTQSGRTIVIGEANNGLEAVETCTTVHPDIILMDVDMPIMNGIEAALTIRRSNKEVKIIMLTSHDSDNDILAAFAAGADGYILKNRFMETLRTAIDTVRLGSVWLDPAIARRILTLSIVSAQDRVNLEGLLSHDEVETLHAVANSTGDLCLVEPQFVEKLHKLTSVV